MDSSTALTACAEPERSQRMRCPDIVITVEIERTHQLLTLKVNLSDTVDSVKQLVLNQAGIAFTNELALAHRGNLLVNSNSLGSYQIQKNDKLTLRPCNIAFALLPDRGTKVLPFFPDELVLNIRKRLGVNTLCSRLMLDDTKRMQDYYIPNDACLSIDCSLLAGNPGLGSAFEFNSLEDMVKEQFCSDAPDYRTVDIGINFESVCRNSKCDAYGQNIVCPMKMGTFDIGRIGTALRCPECNRIPRQPTKCGFYMTNWKYTGQLNTDTDTDLNTNADSDTSATTDIELISGSGCANTNEYYGFKEGKNANWRWLEITTTPLDPSI